MTFENEEGVNRALEYDNAVSNDPALADIKTWIGDHEIEFQPASEPSDIIWENRHFTPWDRTKKEICVWSFLALMLFVSFIIIFIFSAISQGLINKYPFKSASDCQSLIGSDDPALM